MCSRLGSKRVVGNRPGGFIDGLLVGLRVVGDLSRLLTTVHEKQIKHDQHVISTYLGACRARRNGLSLKIHDLLWYIYKRFDESDRNKRVVKETR